MNTLLETLIKNFMLMDLLIVLLFFYNIFVVYRFTCNPTQKLYRHFTNSGQLGRISRGAKKRIKESTTRSTPLSDFELMSLREKMNKNYALFTNITSMFPLFGMLGTVMALIPMVNTIGSESTSSFFAALTSTFWGIVSALICKFFDSKISYKIDDNEKFMEFLLNPKVTDSEGSL